MLTVPSKKKPDMADAIHLTRCVAFLRKETVIIIRSACYLIGFDNVSYGAFSELFSHSYNLIAKYIDCQFVHLHSYFQIFCLCVLQFCTFH